MRGAAFLGFFLVLPPLAALGHDLYRAYGEETPIDISNPFELSETGWLWQNYSPDTWRIAKAGFEPETWSAYIVPLLKMEAAYLAAIPALIFFAVLLALKLVRSGALALQISSGKGGKNSKFAADAAVDIGKKTTQMKYRRK